MSTQFFVLLLGSFILEACGYVAFPYISLRLRDGYGLSYPQAAALLAAVTALRVPGVLLSARLLGGLRPFTLLASACAAEAVCFVMLGLVDDWRWAAVALAIGNVGFALWDSKVFDWGEAVTDRLEPERRVRLLNVSQSSGSAFGALLGASIASIGLANAFVAGGILYVVAAGLLGAIIHGQPTQARDLPATLPFRGTGGGGHAAAFLAALFFWAAYSNVNYFFPVFAKDSLGSVTVIGLSFAVLSLSMTLFSLAPRRPLVFIGAAWAAAWVAMALLPSLPAFLLFAAATGIAEAAFTPALRALWGPAPVVTNFMVRALGMSLGVALGGLCHAAAVPLPQVSQRVALTAAACIVVSLTAIRRLREP